MWTLHSCTDIHLYRACLSWQSSVQVLQLSFFCNGMRWPQTTLLFMKFDHITPVLKSLHWLPVSLRIEYKVSLLTHQCLYGNAPIYLKELITPQHSSRHLRSSQANVLQIPRTELWTMGDGAFCHAAPCLWNAFPDHLRAPLTLDTFKKRPKNLPF